MARRKAATKGVNIMGIRWSALAVGAVLGGLLAWKKTAQG